MLFSTLAHTIAEKFDDIHYEVPHDCDFEDTSMFKGAVSGLEPNCLYIFTPEQALRTDTLPPNMLCFGNYGIELYSRMQESGANYILIPEKSAADTLSYIMQLSGRLAQQQKTYSDIMYMLFNGADLSSVFCKFTRTTGFQVLAIDVSGKVVANSKPFVVNHVRWMNSVEQGYLDDYLVDFIHRRRVEGKMSMSTLPFIRYCDIIKIHVKGIRVIAKGELVGYVFIGGKDGVFPEDSDRLLQAFGRAVALNLTEGRDMNAFHISMHQNILADLADGASEEEAIQRIRSANLQFPRYMRAMVVKNSYFRGSNYLYSTLLPRLSQLLPETPKFIKNGNVVILLEVLSTGKLDEELYSQLLDLTKEQSLRVGISNCFTQPSAFSVYYQQALQAQAVAKQSQDMYGMFFFSDCAFFVMLNNAENKDFLRQMCLPILEEIDKYDTEKKSELYNTLRVYAQTGFNKNKTAEIMYLHRNTINYRIQQLEDLFGIDFSDPTLLFKLQYSFYVDLFLKHRYSDLLASSQ